MFKMNFVVAGAASILLAGCASFSGQHKINSLAGEEMTGSMFSQHLAKDYADLAHFEWDEMMDYDSGELFADKSLAAASGEDVIPEDPANWKISDDYMADLTSYRARLVDVLGRGATDRAPALAATAQVRYDCWVEQQEENLQPDHIAACRDEFEEALAKLEAAVLTQEFMLFFDFDSAKVTAEGNKILDNFAKGLKDKAFDHIEIVGHTDTSGPMSYNDALSMSRAKAVRAALVARGVDGAKVKTRGVGESDLLVSTTDGVREPSNRRAVIVLP